MFTLKVTGYSDDVIELEIKDSNNKSLFFEEFGINNTFKINDQIAVITRWHSDIGHTIGIAHLTEDEILANCYEISYDLSIEYHSPTLVITSPFEISIEGVYGDDIARIRKLLRSEFDDEEIDKFIKIIKEVLNIK